MVKAQLNRHIKNQKGFTLVEIMIVLAILGAIFALLSGRIVGARDKAKVKETQIQMGQISNALAMYYNDCGKYPASLDSLQKNSGDCSNWGPEAYYKKKLVDPWNNPFAYELNSSEYTLKSLGKDGKEGGTEYGKDISADEESGSGSSAEAPPKN
jgi:general secretion pathway protein G